MLNAWRYHNWENDKEKIRMSSFKILPHLMVFQNSANIYLYIGILLSFLMYINFGNVFYLFTLGLRVFYILSIPYSSQMHTINSLPFFRYWKFKTCSNSTYACGCQNLIRACFSLIFVYNHFMTIIKLFDRMFRIWYCLHFFPFLFKVKRELGKPRMENNKPDLGTSIDFLSFFLYFLEFN